LSFVSRSILLGGAGVGEPSRPRRPWRLWAHFRARHAPARSLLGCRPRRAARARAWAGGSDVGGWSLAPCAGARAPRPRHRYPICRWCGTAL